MERRKDGGREGDRGGGGERERERDRGIKLNQERFEAMSKIEGT